MERIRHLVVGHANLIVGKFSVSIFPQDYKRKDYTGSPIRWAHFYCHAWSDVLDVIDLCNPEHITVTLRSWPGIKNVELDARD